MTQIIKQMDSEEEKLFQTLWYKVFVVIGNENISQKSPEEIGRYFLWHQATEKAKRSATRNKKKHRRRT